MISVYVSKQSSSNLPQPAAKLPLYLSSPTVSTQCSEHVRHQFVEAYIKRALKFSATSKDDVMSSGSAFRLHMSSGSALFFCTCPLVQHIYLYRYASSFAHFLGFSLSFAHFLGFNIYFAHFIVRTIPLVQELRAQFIVRTCRSHIGFSTSLSHCIGLNLFISHISSFAHVLGFSISPVPFLGFCISFAEFLGFSLCLVHFQGFRICLILDFKCNLHEGLIQKPPASFSEKCVRHRF